MEAKSRIKCCVCGAEPIGRWMAPAAMLWRDCNGERRCYQHLSDARKAELTLTPYQITMESIGRVAVKKGAAR
jgi:hypothetical protein